MSKELFVKDYILDLLKAVTIKKDNDLFDEVTAACETTDDVVESVLAALIKDQKISSFYWFNKEESGTLFMPEGSRII